MLLISKHHSLLLPVLFYLTEITQSLLLLILLIILFPETMLGSMAFGDSSLTTIPIEYHSQQDGMVLLSHLIFNNLHLWLSISHSTTCFSLVLNVNNVRDIPLSSMAHAQIFAHKELWGLLIIYVEIVVKEKYGMENSALSTVRKVNI